MNEFQNLIIQGSQSALNAAKSLLANPVLIFTGEKTTIPNLSTSGLSGNKSIVSKVGWVVPIEVVSSQKSVVNEVSENLVIAENKKVNVVDNIAIGAWHWQLSGYIGGSSLELTNIYTPFVTLQTTYLEMAATEGYFLIYKDSQNNIHKNCVIKSFTLKDEADARNKRPFSMEIVQINVMDTTSVLQSALEKFSKMAVGSILGATAQLGVTVAVDKSVEGLARLAG